MVSIGTSNTDRTRGQYRAIVIGCGQIGSRFSEAARLPGIYSHAEAYSLNPRTKLVGVADTDPGQLLAAAEHWETEASSNAIDLCRRLEPDIVSVCTPDDTHYAIGREVLLTKPPRLLFMEKPLASTTSQATELIELAREQGTALLVNYSRRFSIAFQTIADELKSGEHGRVLLVRVLYGKGLLHNGGHAIDLLRMWLGEPAHAWGWPAAWGPGEDATFDVELSFAGETRARLEAFDERAATVFELDCLAERSRWRFWMGGARWEFAELLEGAAYSGYRNYLETARHLTDVRFERPLADCLANAITNVANFLDGRGPLLCTGEDGLAVLTWVESIRAASH